MLEDGVECIVEDLPLWGCSEPFETNLSQHGRGYCSPEASNNKNNNSNKQQNKLLFNKRTLYCLITIELPLQLLTLKFFIVLQLKTSLLGREVFDKTFNWHKVSVCNHIYIRYNFGSNPVKGSHCSCLRYVINLMPLFVQWTPTLFVWSLIRNLCRFSVSFLFNLKIKSDKCTCWFRFRYI